MPPMARRPGQAFPAWPGGGPSPSAARRGWALRAQQRRPASLLLPAHRARKGRSEDVHLAARAGVEGSVERLALDHLEARTRRDAALGQEAKHLGIGVGG